MADDARLQMMIEQFDAEGIKGGADGGNLVQDIHAIAIVIDHALDPGDLAGDPADARF